MHKSQQCWRPIASSSKSKPAARMVWVECGGKREEWRLSGGGESGGRWSGEGGVDPRGSGMLQSHSLSLILLSHVPTKQLEHMRGTYWGAKPCSLTLRKHW